MKCEQPGAAAVSTLAAAAAPQLAQTSEQKAAVGLQRPSVVLKRQHVPPHNCGCSGQPLALGVVALVGALLMVLLQVLGVVL